MRRIKKVFSGAGLLAVSAAASKLLGAMFRIPLTNIIGAEGMGLYQMVFPLYTMLLTVSSGGLSIAISKLVAASLAKQDENGAIKILKTSLVSLLTFAGAASLFLIAFRTRIAALQGNPAASLAYLAIAPSIVFVAVISSLKGYFQGRGNMLPSGLSQIIEQSVKLFFGLYFAALLIPHGVAMAAFGTLLGVTLSELISMLVLLFQFMLFYFKRRRRIVIPLKKLQMAEAAEFVAPPFLIEKKTGDVLKSLYKIAVPITLGSLIMPLTQLIDSVMVINVLASQNMTRTAATSLFGLVSGPIGSLINMPIVITLSISVALLPKIAFLKEREEMNQAKRVVAKSITLTLLISLPSTAVFMFFSKYAVEILYSRGLTQWQIETAAALLQIESLSVLYVGLVQIATAVLQGTDKPHRPAINLLYGAIVKVLMTLILLPRMGIKGAAIATVLCYGTTSAIDIIYMLKIIKPPLGLVKTILSPLFATALFVICTYLLMPIFNSFLTSSPAFVCAALLGGAVYILFLLITKTVKPKEFL